MTLEFWLHLLLGANVGATIFLLRITWLQGSMIDDILDLIEIEKVLKSFTEEEAARYGLNDEAE